MKRILVTLTCVSMSSTASDLGVQGTVFDIVEPDMRAVIMEQVEEMDLGSMADDVEQNFNSFEGSKVPSFEFNPRSETAVRLFDPSVIATRDIWAMIPDANGVPQRTRVVAKGQKANPLEHQRPVNALLYIDGESKPQVEFLRRALDVDPDTIVPVLTRGSAVKLSEEWGRPVTRAFKYQVDRLKITHTPSLVFPGEGEHQYKIVIVEFGESATGDMVSEYWTSPLSEFQQLGDN